MIDVHSHIIFEVDDGSKSLEQSINMIKEAEKAGFTKIVATPHYMEEYYEVEKQEIAKKINIIKKELLNEGCNVEILQGNEIYFSSNIVDLIENQKASTYNNNKYVLFELPLNAEVLNIDQIVYQILENGNIPVLAHPERYPFVQKDPNKLIPLIEIGVLMQSNYGSIIGQYKGEAQKTVRKMLEHNMVHLLGSDAHRSEAIYTKVPLAMDELENIVGEEILEELTVINPEKIIKGEQLEIYDTIPIQTGFFNKLFKKN